MTAAANAVGLSRTVIADLIHVVAELLRGCIQGESGRAADAPQDALDGREF